jgi:hypothetical protein
MFDSIPGSTPNIGILPWIFNMLFLCKVPCTIIIILDIVLFLRPYYSVPIPPSLFPSPSSVSHSRAKSVDNLHSQDSKSDRRMQVNSPKKGCNTHTCQHPPPRDQHIMGHHQCYDEYPFIWHVSTTGQ